MTSGTARASAPQATTFHSFCYALVRAHQDADLFAEPLRLLSGPEQDVVVRELLAGQLDLEAEGRARTGWPDELRACLTTRGFADEVRAVLARSRELGLGPGRPGRVRARAPAAPTGERPRPSSPSTWTSWTCRASSTTRNWCTARCCSPSATEVAARSAARYDAVFVDEYQDTDPAQVRLLRALAGGGRTLVAFGDPDQSIYAFRGADVNGILDFPDAFRARGRPPAPVQVLRTVPPLRRRTARRHPAADPPDAAAPGSPPRRYGPTASLRRVRGRAAGSRRTPIRRPAPNSTTSPTSCAAPIWRTASPGARWPSWSARAAARSRRSAAP